MADPFPWRSAPTSLVIDGRELNCAFARDITERKRADLIRTRARARLDLFISLERRSAAMTEREIAQEGLEVAVAITESTIGYFHLVDDDQQNLSLFTWSGRAMAECTAANPAHYPLDSAGVWADCVRTRGPVVHNDFAHVDGRKGYPEGHSPILRHVSVPVFEGDKIRMILGVGNKPSLYDDMDIRELETIGREIWGLMGRHRANAAVRESERRFRTLFERAPEGIFFMTLEGRFVRVNPSFAAMHGYEIDEMTDMEIAQLDTLGDAALRDHPERREQLMTGDVLHFEVEHHHKSGHTFPVMVTSCLMDLEGERFIVGFHRDLTDERRLQDRVRETEKLAAVGELAAGVAHEFNNIMATPMMVAENLLIGISEGQSTMTASTANRLRDVIAAVTRGRNIVNNLLTFARPQRQEGQAVVLSELVDGIAREIAGELQEKHIDIHQRCKAARSIAGDPMQLTQVLRNLVTNAIHAMIPHGRGTLRLETEDRNGLIAIRVQDDGIGITPEDRQRLFTPFFTTKGAFARDALGIPGTGLGLAVSRSIVEAHGGEIRVADAAGGGTTFTVLLPAVKNDGERLPRSAADGSPAGPRGMSFLVVDDEAPLRRSLVDLLKALGAGSVRDAGSTADALTLLREPGAHFDIVLLDWMMPGDGGAVFLDVVRDLAPSLPVVVISGKVGLAESAVLDGQVAGVLGKPFTLDDLVNVLHAARNGRPASG